MFKFDSQYSTICQQFDRFANQWETTNDGYLVDSDEGWSEWERVGKPTICRRCGTSIDEFPSKMFRDTSDKLLTPMFQLRRPNGDKTGYDYRFVREVGFKGFCESCCHDLVPWFQRLADVCEVIRVVNYLERSIRCQRNNNPVEKSKLLVNLGQCLSTPPSVY